MIRALVFDLDDTLFPEREYVLSGFHAVDHWLRSEKSVNGFIDRARAEFSCGARGGIFNRALSSLGVRDEAQLVRQMVDVYRNHIPEIRLFPDAVWALDHYSYTCPIALLTDGYLHVQQRKVSALGIADRFQAIVYSDRFGRKGWKPSALPYQQIIEELRCAPTECIYIADNPAKDFITARRLNWFTIRVRRPGGEHCQVRADKAHEADVVIDTLRALRIVI